MSVKSFIKKFIPKKIWLKSKLILNKGQKEGVVYGKKKKLFYIMKNYFKDKTKIYYSKSENIGLLNMYKDMDLTIKNKDDFINFIDETRIYYTSNNYSNGTVDYSLIVFNSLEDLINKATNEQMKKEYKTLVEIINLIENKNKGLNCKYLEYLKNIKTKKAQCFEEALQRILFLNSILWQTGHRLMGLGRMDLYLNCFIKNIKEEDLLNDTMRFFVILHNHYKFKSGELIGDTGQVIICGGLKEDGNYFSNKLSYIFIKALKQLKLPDPKVLLRVSNNMPIDLLELATDCIKTGIGSPLLSNDEVIVPILKDFGYETNDAYNYVVSACWEPFPMDVSAELNNISSFNLIGLFEKTLEDENIFNCKNIDDILEIYYEKIDIETSILAKKISDFVFDDELLASCFNKACLENGKLLKDFGAKYNNFGVTGLGFPNVVDSIISIDEIVFKQKKKNLKEFLDIVRNNFKNEDNLKKYIKDDLLKFGNDDKYVINLSNTILNKIKSSFKRFDKEKRKIKFGLSSPDYVFRTRNIKATPDGRIFGEPVNVHISCSKPLPYTELVSFASKLDYTKNAFNGNVLDFIVSPSFIDNNFDKFVEFLRLSIKKGFFQMQMNVVSSRVLIEAKQNPKLYPNLIVRVWGFSAYFNDLPEDFKDVLIERAKNSENVN